MTSTARSRLLAGLVDLGLAMAWALVVAAVGVPLYLTGQTRALGPLALNLVGLALVVLPVTVALTVMECGRYEATPGKLKLGLRVRRDSTGERISWQRSLLRNLLKLGVPWSLGHLAAIALAAGGGVDAQIGAIVSMAVPISYLVTLFIGEGRTVYDRLAGTMVIGTAPGRRFA